MDPATVIALCKENIQPLRYGRNAAQLGTALRAQEDTDAQQLLLQEKQMYEDAIKNYEGDDPLENWYEYVLWVEQSYPKSGHESHIGRLLQQCLAMFEKEPKYHQDRRYVRLWINYISMQKNPLELYQLLYSNGIGTMVADMYRAWAFELEQIEDYKRADEVYMMGLSALAEPQDELDYAHKNFQLAVARKTLGRTEDRCEMSLLEQRQAFSSLRAIKAGKRVGSVRVGHRVREHYPGTVPQLSFSAQHARANSRVQIYQDDAGGDMKSSSILDHVPVEEAIHKENTIKPGPWNSGNKRCPLMSSTMKAAFKIHEDVVEDSSMEKLRLFPNHTPFFDGSRYHEHLTVPVFVPDPPNPNVILRPHYPKELVYANNMDQSMEEIRAQRYLERYPRSISRVAYESHYMDGSTVGSRRGQRLEVSQEVPALCPRELELEGSRQSRQKSFESEQRRQEVTLQELQRQRREFEQREMTERQRKLEQQRREAERLEIGRQRLEARYELKSEAVENQGREAAAVVDRRELDRMEAERIEAERIEAERIEAQRMEAELNTQRKLQPSNFLHAQHGSPLTAEATEDHLLGQSLTVNTKEAMSVVQDLWRSPEAVGTGPPVGPPSGGSFRAHMSPRMAEAGNKLTFDIHMDGSMTQHAMSTSKHHPGYNIQPYEDQENHQSFATPFAGQGHQPYGTHELQSSYQFQIQQHHEQQVQHSRQQQPQHHQQLMHQPVSHSQQHLQSHGPLHHQAHLHSPQSQPPHPQQHQSPHEQHLQQHPHHQHHHHQQQQAQPHLQHMQHSVYGNMLPSDMSYQQYSSPLENTLLQQNVDPQKQIHFAPYEEAEVEPNKPYRMPPELPYIKSPGMNRRDIKYLESAEDKENTIIVDYNGPLEENMVPKPPDENNLYVDDSLGIAPLSGSNETSCFTEAFNTQLTSSTPITNQFRQSYRVKETGQYHSGHCVAQSQGVPETPAAGIEVTDKLSVILETTREYVSSSSGSCGHTRTAGLGFTITREDMVPIKERRTVGQGPEEESAESLVSTNQSYEQKLHAQIQALHAQSPRTVQRNVDQITTEIKNNCDLRKSISFKISGPAERAGAVEGEGVAVAEAVAKGESDGEGEGEGGDGTVTGKPDSMDCEEHEPMEQVEEEECSFHLPATGDINPFDKNLIAGLLKNIKFPQQHHADGYARINTNLNKFVPSTMITLGNEAYDLEKCLGKGMYGTVFKAVNLQTGQTVALKTQKPAWVWEYYIVREIKSRLTNPHMLRGFMDVSMAYIANNGSVLVSEYSKFGTLLAVTNQIKIATGKPLMEPLAIFFTIEMLQIVEYLHKCQIIHGDIKPDNFLLMRLPTEDVRPTIQLIDFGCSIDMKILPEKTTFTQVIKTEDFTCIEMQTGRPWTYQTDLYCLAATSHCLLFGNYMRVSNIGGRWFISSKLPRYARKAAWEQFFTELLNVESCDNIPDLSKLRIMMEETLAQMSEIQSRIRSFVNILNKR